MKKDKKQLYDFKPFGHAIKEARKAKGWTRDTLSGELHLAPRYILSIENDGQHPGLPTFYELVTAFNISVGQFFFSGNVVGKSTRRRQLENLLDGMDNTDLVIMLATENGIQTAKAEGVENS